MLSEAECSFSTDSLDDRAIRDENSQRDSSTMISEFSSTRTLMNIDDEGKRCFDEEASAKGFFLSRRYSDSMEIERETENTEYSWETRTSTKEETFKNTVKIEIKDDTVESSVTNGRQKVKSEKVIKTRKSDKSDENIETKSSSMNTSVKSKRDSIESSSSRLTSRKKLKSPTRESSISPIRSPSPGKMKSSKVECSTIDKQRNIKVTDKSKHLRSTEKLSTKSSRSIKPKDTQDTTKKSIDVEPEVLRNEKRKKIVLDFNEFPPPRSEKRSHGHSENLNVSEVGCHLSPIEENSEASTGSGQSKIVTEKYTSGKSMETGLEYDHARKYHTYPKSRIPVARWSKERRFGNFMMDPMMYPLEPREIDLEAFQQLHTVDSQEELQEFLLLESQCSGNLGLAGNMSASEVSCSEHHSEDERGTMSGILIDRLKH